MSESNPLIQQIERSIKHGRLTIGEQIEASAWLEMQLPNKIDSALNKPAELIALSDTVSEASKQIAQGDELIGLSTGYRELDKLTRGIRKSEIVVVFGDTSHGKSQLTQNITLNLAAKQIPVLFVGLEMNNIENTVRFLQMQDSPDESLPILYPKSNDLGYKQIDNLVKAAVAEGVQMVVIDHLHMFARDVTNLANELSLICHEFKRVARAYEVPIIVVSHINRGKEGSGPPQLKDLKGSSSIEQDADICLAVWNRDMVQDSQENKLTVMCRKNRRGRKQLKAELAILPNARLAEHIVMDVFPTG